MKENTSRSSSCSSLKICLLSILFLTETVVAIKLPPNLKIPALIAFGDSIVDTGNNNNVKTVVKCDFQPYGINFQGGVPTGRFCDGRVPADLLGPLSWFFMTLPFSALVPLGFRTQVKLVTTANYLSNHLFCVPFLDGS